MDARCKDFESALRTEFSIEVKLALFRHGLPQPLRIKAVKIQETYGFQIRGSPRAELIAAIQEAYDADRTSPSKSSEKGSEVAPAKSKSLPPDDTADPASGSLPEASPTKDGATPIKHGTQDTATPSSKRPKLADEDATVTTSDDAGSTVAARAVKRRRKKPTLNANTTQAPKRTNVKKLACTGQETTGTAVNIKSEVKQDSKRKTLYFLGNETPAYLAFPLLISFTSDVHTPAPSLCGVDTLPMTTLMVKIIKDTVHAYARSRTNQTANTATTSMGGTTDNEETVKDVPIDAQTLSEPVNITQPANFLQALKNVTEFTRAWIKGTELVVQQRMIESWALNVVLKRRRAYSGRSCQKELLYHHQL